MPVLEKEAKVTAQGQITVPAQIREVLGVEPGGHVTFAVEADGTVIVRGGDEPDPSIGAFLEFLAEDIRQHPQNVRPLAASLEASLRELTAETVIDRDGDRIHGPVGL